MSRRDLLRLSAAGRAATIGHGDLFSGKLRYSESAPTPSPPQSERKKKNWGRVGTCSLQDFIVDVFSS